MAATYFSRVKGRTRFTEKLLSVTQTVAIGDVMYPNPATPGQVIIADSTAGRLLGCAAQTRASSASTQTISVEQPLEPTVEWTGPREAGTLTVADIDEICDLNTEDGLAVDTTTKGHFWVTGVISADIARGIFVAMHYLNAVETT